MAPVGARRGICAARFQHRRESEHRRDLAQQWGGLHGRVTNKAAKGRKGALVTMIKGVASDNVIEKLKRLGLSKRRKVQTVTADLSGSMKYIASKAFPSAEQISDRFHVQQLMSQAIDEMRIELRWEVIKIENEQIRLSRQRKMQYRPKTEAIGAKNKDIYFDISSFYNGAYVPFTESPNDYAILKVKELYK